MLVTRLVSRVRSVFGVELSVRVVFDALSVGELGVVVESLLVAGSGGSGWGWCRWWRGFVVVWCRCLLRSSGCGFW